MVHDRGREPVVTVDALTPDLPGVWLVFTESGSIYAVDVPARTVTRVPDPDADQDTSAALRFDGTTLHLHPEADPPFIIREGSGGLFMIRHPDDPNRIIFRRTTTVEAIIRSAELVPDH